jgi:hypothetical protein
MERLAAARENFLERIVDVLTERRAIFDKLQAVHVPTNLRAMQAATASWLQARACRQCMHRAGQRRSWPPANLLCDSHAFFTLPGAWQHCAGQRRSAAPHQLAFVTLLLSFFLYSA